MKSQNNKKITFGQLIRFKRKQKRYSQREFAELIDIHFTYLSKMENNNLDYFPSKKVIKKIANILDLDPIELQRLAGKIDEELDLIINYLGKTYNTKFWLLLKKMNEDKNFAEKVLALSNDQLVTRQN